MASVVVRARARRDILLGAAYLKEQGGTEVAESFVDAVQEASEALGRMPKMGVQCAFLKPAARALRRWPIKNFEQWLIFYKARRQGVEIVRVVHGARDIEALLD